MSKENVSAFIDDGYTQDGFIEAMPGLCPDIEFEFRPMTHREQVRLSSEVFKEKDAGECEVLAAQAMVEHIHKWDIKNASGEVVSITVDSLLRLKTPVFKKLYDIVRAEEPSDSKSKLLTEEQNQKN